jgi:23S rRNA (adenine2503-C2)-methyltransferase
MDFNELQHQLQENKEPQYRYTQIASDVVSGRVSSFEDIFTIPTQLRQHLSNKLNLFSANLQSIQASSDKRAYKALLILKDDHLIETVLLNPSPNLWSVCLSCQVGCAMGCAFCATGKQGLTRNLTSEEICDQILFWRQYIAQQNLKIRITNIVYMGMGEPFTNLEAVLESIGWFIDPKLYGFGQRHISVSTCGIPAGIEALARTFPQVNLAVSLHAPSDNLRKELIPVAHQFSLEQLMSSLGTYLTTTNRQIFFEYVMLSGKNDADTYAIELGNLLTSYFPGRLHLVHVNLIPYNVTGNDFFGSTIERMEKFESILNHFHIRSTIRKSLGQDISGACGQLKGKLEGESL